MRVGGSINISTSHDVVSYTATPSTAVDMISRRPSGENSMSVTHISPNVQGGEGRGQATQQTTGLPIEDVDGVVDPPHGDEAVVGRKGVCEVPRRFGTGENSSKRPVTGSHTASRVVAATAGIGSDSNDRVAGDVKSDVALSVDAADHGRLPGRGRECRRYRLRRAQGPLQCDDTRVEPSDDRWGNPTAVRHAGHGCDDADAHAIECPQIDPVVRRPSNGFCVPRRWRCPT